MKSIERIVPLSAFRDNYIWALCTKDACLVVDPGEAGPVLAFLAAEKLQLAAILLTHRHADHQGGVAELLAHRPVPVYGPQSPAMPLVSHPLRDGERFNPSGMKDEFSVLAVPGHTEEHIAYLLDDALFCGDTLFAAGCGRLLGGTAAQLHASLGRLAALPTSTRVHCAHEYTLSNLRFARAVEPANPATLAREQQCQALRSAGTPTVPSLLADELETNPFLRAGRPEVARACEAQAGRPLKTPLEVFTELRRWKDGF